ncbi:hypothetical protein BVX99_00295 [bacterium F16]|nr:hypothetical protein BVX99_00295 [bacterium F16]
MRILTIIEPAFWGEMFWDQQSITYSNDGNRSYSVGDLKQHSWAFYFNQDGHKPVDAVEKLVNSYNVNDYALWAMTVDDYHIRNPGDHWPDDTSVLGNGRRTPDDPRIAVPGGWFSGSDSRNLAHQIPALLKKNHIEPVGKLYEEDDENGDPIQVLYKPEYLLTDIEPCQGMQSLNMANVTNINAETDGGFNEWSHNGHKGGGDSEIPGLTNNNYDNSRWAASAVLALSGNDFSMSLPEVWNWYKTRLEAEGSVDFTKE